jgi:cell wall-associated protease
VKPRLLISAMALTFAACAPASTSAPTAPTPRPAAEPPRAAQAAPTPAPKPALTEAPSNWQLLDETADGVPGISSERAMRELLAGRQPRRTVVVAVIDGGVDTAHVDLHGNLWTNPKEIAGNGRDDDGNGFIDDVRGWNFIGGSNGEDVQYDTFEVTRQHAACMKSATNGSQDVAAKERCAKIAEAFDEKKNQAEQTLGQVQMIEGAMSQILPMLRQAMATDSLTVANVTAFKPATQALTQAKSAYLQLAQNGITQDVIEEAKKAYGTQLKYGLDPDFDPRSIVGDNYADPGERHYGNSDVMGPDSHHGTHVSGIIGAIRGNGVGVDGIAPAVRIMSVRTVPDGDERDKDVANAIRYAVDNGANVINMSFGKDYSPYKPAVDEAVKYADSKGVLMVHAAGNDGADLGEKENYPTPMLGGGSKAANWIEVGASSWKGGENLAASFSNYGKDQVDVFAPGEDVLSTMPGGEYKREDGTSMAAPVVSGLAALIMAYYPQLTAAEVKQVILQSVTSHADQVVLLPGSGPAPKRVPFGTLSRTGGIVNAFAALRMAEQMAAKKAVSH